MSQAVRVTDLPAQVAAELRRGVAGAVTSRGRRVAMIVPEARQIAGTTFVEAAAAWRARHPELPDDPFEGAGDVRVHSPPREVDW
jgi:antitoxin (DNA-binding transcriptional repressor) of toxin-antitoxin stability system